MANDFDEAMPCPICGGRAQVRLSASFDQYLCERCGLFQITGSAAAVLSHQPFSGQKLANVSGWVRDQREPRIVADDLDFLASLATPPVMERTRKALRYLGRLRPGIGQTFAIEFSKADQVAPWLAATWSQDATEVEYLFEVLLGRGWIVGSHVSSRDSPGHIGGIKITPAGHEELERMRQTHPEATLGFCAMWFDPRLNVVWTDAIAPAIEDSGYGAKRIDAVEHNNKIDDEIVATIRQSRFVVADFTGGRGGVYFEAGFAMGLRIPVVWTVRKDELQAVHFDNRQYNFIEWVPDDLGTFRTRLQNRIEATIGKGPLRKR